MIWGKFLNAFRAQRTDASSPTPFKTSSANPNSFSPNHQGPANAAETLFSPSSIASSESDTASSNSDKENSSNKNQPDDTLGNVVNLQSRIRSAPHEYRNYSVSSSQPDAEDREDETFKGLLDDPVLKNFFRQNFWGFGHYDGAHYKSHEAMELGKNAIIARFQNTLSITRSRKQAHLTKLRATVIETEGVSATITAQLQLACRHVEADIQTLQEQLELATERKGWVFDALNRYQIGFAKGLRDTIPFERLL